MDLNSLKENLEKIAQTYPSNKFNEKKIKAHYLLAKIHLQEDNISLSKKNICEAYKNIAQLQHTLKVTDRERNKLLKYVDGLNDISEKIEIQQTLDRIGAKEYLNEIDEEKKIERESLVPSIIYRKEGSPTKDFLEDFSKTFEDKSKYK